VSHCLHACPPWEPRWKCYLPWLLVFRPMLYVIEEATCVRAHFTKVSDMAHWPSGITLEIGKYLNSRNRWDNRVSRAVWVPKWT
jgi:hypothetical protein